MPEMKTAREQMLAGRVVPTEGSYFWYSTQTKPVMSSMTIFSRAS